MNYEKMWKDLQLDLVKLKSDKIALNKILIPTERSNGIIQGIEDSIDRMQVIEELEKMNRK